MRGTALAFLLVCAFLPVFSACSPSATNPSSVRAESPLGGTEFAPDRREVELTLEIEDEVAKTVPFADLYSVGPLSELSLEDSLFGESRRYAGLTVEQLQALVGAGSRQKVLKFHCRDGYVSEVETDILRQGRFILAVRDLDAAPDAFVPFERMTYLRQAPEKAEMKLSDASDRRERERLQKEVDRLKTLRKDMETLGDQGPFYPVFIPSDTLPKEKSWLPPFCVDKVTFARSKTDKSLAHPKGLPDEHPAMRGNRLFESLCSSCHKVNGIGGAVGPELNRPLSVTEYWDHNAIRRLLKDPASVREGSKMPAFHLSDDKIDDIVAYLEWMSRNKR